jgi:type I restriction enzyme S subunit
VKDTRTVPTALEDRANDEILEGWALTLLGELGAYLNGRAFKASEWRKSGRPIIRIQDLTGSGSNPNFFQGNLEDRYVVRNGDLLISWAATLGAFIWDGPEAVLNQHIFKVESRIEKKFHYYLVCHLLDDLQKQTHGSGMVHITKNLFDAAPVALPPLAEQKRIVAKAEELLARVNAARERLARVPALLKRFRQAALAAACEGRLTEGWRRERKIPMFGEATLGEHCLDSFYGPRFGRDEYVSGGVPTIRTTDFLEHGEIDLGSLAEAPTVRVPANKKSKFLLQAGDLLVTRTGSVGKMAIFRGGIEAIPSAYVIRFRFTRDLQSDFVQTCLLSPKWQELLGLGSTAVTQPNINAETIKALSIPFPSINEQHEIVRRVEALFKLADAIEQRVAAATSRAERLTQAILAKAFRGELVPTEAELARREGRAYETGAELLDRIRSERAGAGTNDDDRRRRSRPGGTAERSCAQVRRGA